MAKVPQYTQDKLASSIMPVVVDNSAAQLTGHLKGNVDKIADTTFKLAAEKQKEVDAINAKIKNVNGTLTAYDRSIAIENEMYDIIEEEKANNINNPQLAVKNVEARGRELIATRMAELDNTTDIAVKEKMAGIITNSFRGKLSELHTWQVGQDTANAQGKIDSMINGLMTRASKSGSLETLAECLNFDNYIDANGNPLSDSIKMAYGNKGVKEIQKAKENIAESYIMGLLDRKTPNQVNAVLDSGALDSIISPEKKLSLKKMAKTMVTAQNSAAKRDAYFEIYNIKENATLLAAEGKYTPSMYMQDKRRIAQLGGKASDYNVILSKSMSSDKISKKENFKQNQQIAHDKVTKEWARISGKSGKISPNAELEDILKFQNLVEENREYFTGEQYDNYMIKLNKSRVKRVKDMRTDVFGRPQGTLKGDDNYSKGYTQIYKFAQTNYKGDDAKRLDAINNMTGEFVKRAERAEAQTGKPLTEAQMQSIVKGVTTRQTQRTNPHLQNIPKNGQLFKDKSSGRVYRIYPDGRREVVK